MGLDCSTHRRHENTEKIWSEFLKGKDHRPLEEHSNELLDPIKNGD